VEAARRAIENPLLETKLEWAKKFIFAVTWWEDLTPMEVQEAANVIREIADEDADIIWWMTLDSSYDGDVKVTIIATWFPEATQESIITNSTSAFNPRRTTPTITRSTGSWEDFVKRALKEEASINKVTTFGNIVSDENKQDIDDDTPAFVKRKLLK